jgi:hypothetical protein
MSNELATQPAGCRRAVSRQGDRDHRRRNDRLTAAARAVDKQSVRLLGSSADGFG